METQTVKALRDIAKHRGLRGYYRLHKGQLIDLLNTLIVGLPAPSVHPAAHVPNLLDSPVPTIQTPTLQPTAYNPVPFHKSKSIKKSFADWADWLISHVPEPEKKPVNEKLEALKSTVSELFGEPESPFNIVESKSAIKNFTKQHTIDGKQGTDAATFLNTVRPLVVNLLEINRNTKFQLVLTCTMKRVSILTGEVITTDAPFLSRTEVNLEATDLGELYTNAIDKIKESLANFQLTGSNWRFKAVQKLEINTVKYRPLKGSSYIPLPKELANKKAIINMTNTDNECFKWCVVRALNPVARDSK